MQPNQMPLGFVRPTGDRPAEPDIRPDLRPDLRSVRPSPPADILSLSHASVPVPGQADRTGAAPDRPPGRLPLPLSALIIITVSLGLWAAILAAGAWLLGY